MDQAKCKTPRNVEHMKAWPSRWRPQTHTIGMMIEGLLEMYLISDADVPNDSNMECTCIAIALDRAYIELQKLSVDMPEVLHVNYDNTGREGKNQHVAKLFM